MQTYGASDPAIERGGIEEGIERAHVDGARGELFLLPWFAILATWAMCRLCKEHRVEIQEVLTLTPLRRSMNEAEMLELGLSQHRSPNRVRPVAETFIVANEGRTGAKGAVEALKASSKFSHRRVASFS